MFQAPTTAPLLRALASAGTLVLLLSLLGAAGAYAQQAAPEELTAEERRRQYLERVRAELQSERPIAARDTVWLEELTWMEVRDALAAGTRTIIVSTGGIEQNGPYVALGKHNYILQSACEAIARELGDALCAPIIKLVPEGGIDEPSGHMLYPGTLSARQETFEAILEDFASSLRVHGFEHIVFIGDSGGNQAGMRIVAERLNERWEDSEPSEKAGTARIHYIAEFYEYDALVEYMNEELGIVEPQNDGVHDFYWATALQMVTDPSTVRYEERVAAGKATINGVSIEPLEKTVEVGRKLLHFRVESTVAAIRAARER